MGHNYYVSFDNEKVGELIGMGLTQCVSDWGVKSPKVFTVDGGEDTDFNAIAFATGYNKAVWNMAQKQVPAGTTNSAGFTLVGEQYAPGWDNTKGGQIFQQEFTANPQINATMEANDGLANAVITDLKGERSRGQDDPDHRTGRDGSGDGVHPSGLAVRFRVQGHLQGGGRRGRSRHHPAGR